MGRRAPRGQPRRPPVLLCHGLSANRASLDFGVPRYSLALALANAGFDSFALDLRGHGDSRRGSPPAWSFDTYLSQDIPAALDEVRAATGAEQVLWLGHSQGALLGLVAAGMYPSRIAGVVALAPPTHFHAPRGAAQALALRLPRSWQGAPLPRASRESRGGLVPSGPRPVRLELAEHRCAHLPASARQRRRGRAAAGDARVPRLDAPRPLRFARWAHRLPGGPVRRATAGAVRVGSAGPVGAARRGAGGLRAVGRGEGVLERRAGIGAVGRLRTLRSDLRQPRTRRDLPAYRRLAAGA